MSGYAFVRLATLLCWILREEVEPDCEPNCWPENHPACWVGIDPEGDWLDYDDAPAKCRWNQIHALCDLDQGHSGEHVFMGEDSIVLNFSEARP